MDEEGNSSLVYPHNVQVTTVYDPKGMLVTIQESSELKEFVINSASEFARVGRKGMVVKLSTETLLLTFASDEVSHVKLHSSGFKFENYLGFQQILRVLRADQGRQKLQRIQ